MQELLLSLLLFFFLFVFLPNGYWFFGTLNCSATTKVNCCFVFNYSIYSQLLKGATFCSKVLLILEALTWLMPLLFLLLIMQFHTGSLVTPAACTFLLQFHTGWFIFAVVCSHLCPLCDWPLYVVLFFSISNFLFHIFAAVQVHCCPSCPIFPKQVDSLDATLFDCCCCFVDFSFCLCFLNFAFFCHLPNDGKTKPGSRNLMFGFSRKFAYFYLSALLAVYNLETNY